MRRVLFLIAVLSVVVGVSKLKADDCFPILDRVGGYGVVMMCASGDCGATTVCYDKRGRYVGSVTCNGPNGTCSRTGTSVTCDGVTTSC